MTRAKLSCLVFALDVLFAVFLSSLPAHAQEQNKLRIPQSAFVTRGEVLQKYPETTKRFLKAVIMGMQFTKHNKQEAIKTGYASGLKSESDVVNRAYDLFSPGYATDLSVAQDGIQIMLDEDIRAGVVEKSFTLDRVINDRILKQAQQELRKEGRLK